MGFKYKIENLLFNELEQRAVVPKFQRKLVWSKNEKKSFIETLSKGYPFGAILIYKYENEDKYSIVDGLQRYTTIKDYVSNPQEYVKFDDIIEREILSTFLDVQELPASTVHNIKRKLNDVIEDFTKEALKGNNSVATFYEMLEEELPDYFNNISTKEFLLLESIKDNILDRINNHLNVENLPIPTIIFTGEVEELATVFENLNRGGKKLSKYQVFAAQWSKHEIKLSDSILNKRILEITIQRYEDLIESRNVEINNFNRDDMTEKRIINVAEFCFAFGKLILEKMPVFWDKENEDIANQIGYSTLAIVFGVKNKEMNTLINYFEKLDNPDFIESFVAEVLNIYRDINNQFEAVLKVPGISSKSYYGGRSASDFQLLSFFGSLWITKFENLQSGELIVKSRYKKNYKKIEKNLVKYFVFDIVNNKWSGTGDSKLDNVVIEKENYYLKDLDEGRFERALLDWHDEITEKNSINFEPVSKMIYTILSSYYFHKYSENRYDSEHIISRKHINDIRRKTNRPIPGGALGNHMYLDTSNNRSKQEFSLYDMERAGYELKEDFYSFQEYPDRSNFDDIKIELERSNGDYDCIIETIQTRGKNLINDFINKLFD